MIFGGGSSRSIVVGTTTTRTTATASSSLASVFMDCGTAPLCGVLTLETGYGPGNYKRKLLLGERLQYHQTGVSFVFDSFTCSKLFYSNLTHQFAFLYILFYIIYMEHLDDKPTVHGLWPAIGPYGSSRCIPPTNSTKDPTQIYGCYEEEEEDKAARRRDTAAVLWFETHEWEKHGQCAGTETVDTYFQTICALAATPVQIMTEYRRQHHNRTAPNNDDDHVIEAIAIILKSAGYPVYSIDTQNMQIMLSVCAYADQNKEKSWVLADVSEFSSVCGNSSSINKSNSGGGGGSRT